MSARKPYKNKDPLQIARGEGFSVSFTVWADTEHETTANISSSSISLTWTLLNKKADAALISKSSLIITEIEKTDPSNGVFLVKLAPADTEDLGVGSYKFDILLTHTGTTPTTKKIITEGDVVIVEAASL